MLSLLLSLLMLCSLCVNALAVNDVKVTATLDKRAIATDSGVQTVKLTVATAEPVEVGEFGLQLKVPEGWTIKSISNDDPSVGGFTASDYNLANGIVGWNTADLENVSVSTLAVYEIEIPADVKAGSYKLSVEKIQATKDIGQTYIFEDGSASATLLVKNMGETGRAYTVDVAYDGPETVNVGEQTYARFYLYGVGDQANYSACTLKIKYNQEVLKPTLGGFVNGKWWVTDDAENGILTFHRYGQSVLGGNSSTSEDVMLLFKAIARGAGTVDLLEAYVDYEDNANKQDAPLAYLGNSRATINVVQTYKVGANSPNLIKDMVTTAVAGQDYQFRMIDDLDPRGQIVTYTVDGVEMGELTADSDGNYTIPASKITGDIFITLNTKEFNVTKTGSAADNVVLTGGDTAQYYIGYTFQLTKQAGYTYNLTVTVGGEAVTPTLQSTSNDTTDFYVIEGRYIVGDVVINAERTALPTSQITFTGDTTDLVGDVTRSAPQGKDFTFSIGKKDNYIYEVSAKYTESGETIPVTENSDGSYTIASSYINGNAITITITKKLNSGKFTVQVEEYLKLDGKSIWLVLAKVNEGETLGEGNVLAYGTEFMYRNAKQYDGAYAYLVISSLSKEEVEADAAKQITSQTGTAHDFNKDGDVNGTGRMDINDAQLVYNMYNAKYDGFEEGTSMKMFLAADVNGDKTVNTLDSTFIVKAIQ